ncbi:MAG: hypothetical protein H6551_01335 [Chitinophagales bacterium]|nr:hypothetical protein [Chitinophagales bacterium]
MKKYSFLIVAGALASFASCNNDTGNADDAQRQIDSIVNARVDEIRLELQVKNDSIINELAMWRADSIIAAQKGKKVVATKPKSVIRKSEATQMGASGTTAEDKPMDNNKGTVNDRPGASNSGGGVNDRPGASNSGGGVNDRPGAK